MYKLEQLLNDTYSFPTQSTIPSRVQQDFGFPLQAMLRRAPRVFWLLMNIEKKARNHLSHSYPSTTSASLSPHPPPQHHLSHQSRPPSLHPHHLPSHLHSNTNNPLSPKRTISRNTRPIHLRHAHRPPTRRHNLLTKLLRRRARARPIRVLLGEDDGDFGVGGALG